MPKFLQQLSVLCNIYGNDVMYFMFPHITFNLAIKSKKFQQIFLDCFQEYISIQYVNLCSIYHICQTIFHFPVSLYHAFCKKIRILAHMYAVSITFIYIIKSKRLLECLVIMLFQKRAFGYG